ncbi:MAG: hypothetical protein CM15mV94_010 [uncultured marine virus]|nr:MAG: hypothetical protein CM15mV94_010 [uncultured marine virus]
MKNGKIGISSQIDPTGAYLALVLDGVQILL